MVKSPLVVGVRQLDPRTRDKSVEQSLIDLGNNTGNMVFTEALLRALAGAQWGSFLFTPEELEGRDAIVLAAANWINSYDDFGWLADHLERLKLPVFLVGVGAQASASMEYPEIKPGTLRLLRLVADRSTSIAARGIFSCEVLESYGISTAIPTGCPSLTLAGPDGPQLRPVGDLAFDKCALHATRHLFSATDAFQTYLYREAYRNDADLILQSELADMYFALGRRNNPEIVARALSTVAKAYGDDDAENVAAYLADHGKVFMNYPSWHNYMKTKSFCVGTRIHGTIASIVAGTAGTLIAHDSRTLEMAQSMNIPYVRSSEVSTDKPLRLDQFLLSDQLEALSRGYDEYYSRFMEYFDRNGLPIAAEYEVAPDVPKQASS